jgi:hypothetical protein
MLVHFEIDTNRQPIRKGYELKSIYKRNSFYQELKENITCKKHTNKEIYCYLINMFTTSKITHFLLEIPILKLVSQH